MPETINWNFLVWAVHGPQVSRASSLEVEAYDKMRSRSLLATLNRLTSPQEAER